MLKVESFDQIQQFIKQIRALHEGFVTNFYWDPNKHPYWLAEETLYYEQSHHCVLLIHPNTNFANLYYIATDYSAVNTTLNAIQTNSDIVVDIVCKGDGLLEKESFCEMGFELYKSLYRMNHIGPIVQPDWQKEDSVINGSKKDAQLVYQALKDDFDPLCEQLPTLQEVEDYAQRQQLLVVKDKGRLCGFLIAELNGVTWYLRYWYTSPQYRDQGIGAKLLRNSLIDGKNSKRQIFWVIADNENAIKRYEHYGFRKENMNDFVMIKRKQQEQ